jgi:hypothetical protein
MRTLLILVLLLAARAAPGQAPSAASPCNVVIPTAEITDDGKFERPVPTPGQCEAAEALVEKFMATPSSSFRRLFNVNVAPEPVINYIVSVVGRGRSRNPGNFRTGNFEQQTGLSVWLSTELVVMAFRGSDISGSSTTVTLADIDSLTACEYVRWQGSERPQQLAIRDIQDALDAGLVGNRETPTCQLGALPLDLQ